MTRTEIDREIYRLQGQIAGLKRDCKRRYGSNINGWPQGKRELYDHLKSTCKELHQRKANGER